MNDPTASGTRLLSAAPPRQGVQSDRTAATETTTNTEPTTASESAPARAAATHTTRPASGDTDDRTASRRAADLLSSLAWTVMCLFSLALAAGAAVLAVRRDGLVAVGLAAAAVVVALSAAYFLYHLWTGVDVDAQEF